MENKVAKAIDIYIKLKVANHIRLQQIIAIALQLIKTKIRSPLVKILAILHLKNGTKFFNEIKKHYDKNGDNVRMIFDCMHCLYQYQVDFTKKKKLKLWNADNDIKYATSFCFSERGRNDA
jgi:hypothetical protein